MDFDELNRLSGFEETQLRYPIPQSLKTKVSDTTYSRINELRANNRHAVPDQYKAWMHANQIEINQIEQAGFKLEFGVDTQIFETAKKKDKEIQGLATVHRHLATFNSLSDQEQESYLIDTLDSMDTFAQDAETEVTAWMNGDISTLELGQNKLRNQLVLYDHVITQRNQEWIPLLEGFLRENEPALVVVGSLHVIGNDGLLATLQNSGYEIQRRQSIPSSSMNIRHPNGLDGILIQFSGTNDTKWLLESRDLFLSENNWINHGIEFFFRENSGFQVEEGIEPDRIYRLRLLH